MDLGELLVECAGLDPHDVAEIRHESRRQSRPLVLLLVESGAIGEEAIAEHAARALSTILLDLDGGELDDESVRLVPASVARRHLLLPVAPDPDGKSLRVAFADPFDENGVQAVRTHARLDVQPLVATASDLRAAIDRAYGREDDDLPTEVTQRVDRLEASGTAPMLRLEQSATLEQRHEALLLALIEAGALSRVDYVRALRRLLDRDAKD